VTVSAAVITPLTAAIALEVGSVKLAIGHRCRWCRAHVGDRDYLCHTCRDWERVGRLVLRADRRLKELSC